MERITFRKDGHPVPITGSLTCATCGLTFPAESILSVEPGARDSRLAIRHPADHRVSFSIDSADAVTLFIVHSR